MTNTPDKPNAAHKAPLIWGSAIILSALFLWGFIPRFFQDRKLDKAAARVELPQVTIQIAKPDPAATTLTLPSSTQADHITPIWARANGYLVKLLADIGDVVKAGQVLAILDTPDLDEQYKNALFLYEAAIANRDIAKISAARWEAIYEVTPDAISKQELDERIATYLAQEANLQAALATMNQLKDLMEFKNVVAPFDGIITERDVDLGALITAGSAGQPQQLFVIAKTDIIKVYVEVPQCFFRSIQEGVETAIQIREFPGKSFKGIVTRYAKALDPTARTMTTQINIDNSSGELLAGLYADVTFVFPPENPIYTIPTPALIIRAGDPQIALLDLNDTVLLKNVEIGVDSGVSFGIIDGIQTDDKIITNPNEKIQNGVKVEVIS